MGKVGMLWEEVRELVGRTTAARADASRERGISNELAVARLRGKVDHLTQVCFV